MYRLKKKKTWKHLCYTTILIVFALLILCLLIKYSNNNILLLKNIKDFFITNQRVLIQKNKSYNKCTSQEVQINNLKYENEILKKNLKLNNLLSDYQVINATAIYRNPSFWFNTLIIDKGEKDDIKEGLPVITEGTLIGYVEKVSSKTSQIKLITSDNNISVGIEGTNGYNHGLITGYDAINDLLIISGITEYDNVYINAKVVTTGIGSFPSGLLVGYVTKIEDEKYNISKKLYVESAVNLSDIRYVSIIKRSE